MGETVKHRLIGMVVILLFQILVCNNMHVFGYATPIILPFLTMKFHRGTARESLLVWGFIIGLIFDIFSNTLGIGMAACTLLGMMQPVLLGLFSPNESVDMIVPSFKSMGFDRYIYYVFSTLLLFHITFYFLEDFSLQHFRTMLSGAVIGTVISFLLVIVADALLPKDKNID